MLLQGMEGGWVVIEASHTVSSGLNVTCYMLMCIFIGYLIRFVYVAFITLYSLLISII